MKLVWPWLLVVAIVPLIVAVFALWRRRPGESAFPKIRRGFVAGGRPVFSATAPRRRLFWRYAAVFALAALALARPQWGNDSRPVFEGTREVLVALDLSRSTLARDIAPSRLERARTLAKTLTENLPTARLGLIGFAGRAFVLVPPSDEREPFMAFLSGVTPDHIIEQGTDFAAMLSSARDAFTSEASTRTLIVISDGEAQSEAWRAPLAELRQRDVQIIAVGLGTAAGAPIPATADLGTPASTSASATSAGFSGAAGGAWLKDPTGVVVVSRLEPSTLQALAAETAGVYLETPGKGSLLAAAHASVDRPGVTLVGKPEEGLVDRFGLFLIAALLMLCWSAATEWNAVPRLDAVRRRTVAAAATLISAAAVAHVPVTGSTSEYIVESEDVPVSEDPLAPLIAQVEQISKRTTPTAEDFLLMAQATAKYGDEQYTRSVPVPAILRDGLSAVAQGRALDPRRSEWAPLEDALKTLIELATSPPREGGTQDPANEVGSGPSAAPEPEQEPDAAEKEKEQQALEGNGDEERKEIGGSQRELYDPAEWQVASLVVPLDLMENLRSQGSPAEWFRVMQQHAETDEPEVSRPW